MSLRSPFAKGGYRGISHVIVKSPLPPFSKGGKYAEGRKLRLHGYTGVG
jgi:hypothetical protein